MTDTTPTPVEGGYDKNGKIVLQKEIELQEKKERLAKLIEKVEAAQVAGSPISSDEVAAIRNLKSDIQRLEQSFYRDNEFDYDFTYLYLHEPFLGTVSVGVSKRVDYSVPTAYVGIRNTTNGYDVTMGYNPDFMRSLTSVQRQGVIRHELYHLIFQHIFGRSMGDERLAKLWNWATDLAINSIIGKDNLPSLCLIPGQRNIDPATGKPVQGIYADFIANTPLMQSSDFYFAGLLKLMQENNHDESDIKIGVNGDVGTMDDHGQWADVPEEVKEEIRERVREMIGKGAMRADQSNSWGNTPQEIQEWIRKMLSREIDWRTIVKSFIGRVRSKERASSMKRINKKMPYINPGVKRKYRSTFACFIDQSGSMSDKDIAQLFGELEGLAKETEIDVYHFDTEIDEQSHTVWRKGKPFPKPHRTRCGGTDFQAVANFCNSSKSQHWSGVIILTDGYAPTMGQIVGSKVLWVITETGDPAIARPGDLVCQMKKDAGTFKRY